MEIVIKSDGTQSGTTLTINGEDQDFNRISFWNGVGGVEFSFEDKETTFALRDGDLIDLNPKELESYARAEEIRQMFFTVDDEGTKEKVRGTLRHVHAR